MKISLANLKALFAASFVCFAPTVVQAESTFISDCQQNIKEFGTAVRNHPFQVTLADVAQNWAALGMPPKLISDKMAHMGDGNVVGDPSVYDIADPATYVVSNNKAKKVCENLARHIGSINEPSSNISQWESPSATYYILRRETTDEEKRRIPGGWTIKTGNFADANLKTLVATYHVTVNKKLKIPSCEVRFHVFSGIFTNWRGYKHFQLGISHVHGQHYLDLAVPTENNEWEIKYFMSLDPSKPNLDQLAYLAEDQFDFYNNNKITMTYLYSLVKENMREFALAELAQKPSSSVYEELMYSASCENALNAARKRYAQMAQ